MTIEHAFRAIAVPAASVLLALSNPSYAGVPAATVGGARVGMTYGTVKAKLLAAGYQPVRRPRDQHCGYGAQCDLPETDACSGTGVNQCSYIFRKGRVIIEVSGIDGRDDQALSQTVNAIEFR